MHYLIEGGVSGTVSETARYWRGEEVSAGSFAKAIGIGAAAGTIGGASTHLGSNLSKGVSNEIGKAVTRVSVQATTAAATDAGLQLIDKGEIDPKQLILNTAGQITVATTAEISQNISRRTETYASKVNSEVIEESLKKTNDPNIDKKELETQLKARAKELNALPPSVKDEQLKNANEYSKVQSNIQEQTMHKENLLKIHENPNLTGQEKAQQRQQYCRENKLPQTKPVKHINRNINKLNQQAGELRPVKIGDNNAHFLHDDRIGQVALDLNLGDVETGEHRNGERAVFEKHGDTFVYADHTLEHDYDNCRKGVVDLINDPFDALRPEHLNRDFVDINEEEEVGDKKND